CAGTTAIRGRDLLGPAQGRNAGTPVGVELRRGSRRAVGARGTYSPTGYRPSTFNSTFTVWEGTPLSLSDPPFVTSQSRTVSWSASPLASLYSAAAPATCGLAIDVPS